MERLDEVLLVLGELFEGLDADERREVKDKILRAMKVRKEGGGRKEELFSLLSSGERYKVGELGKLMNISEKNVSSLLCYLRKDGVKISIDWEGKRFIEK